MSRTTNKGVRFTAAELEQIETLRMQLPEYSSDADLLHHAALLGIMVLATQAIRPGLTPYAGYAPNDLAALLKPRLMPSIDFLFAQGAMPAVFLGQAVRELAPVLPSGFIAQQSAVTAIDHVASLELEGFGTGLMDD